VSHRGRAKNPASAPKKLSRYRPDEHDVGPEVEHMSPQGSQRGAADVEQVRFGAISARSTSTSTPNAAAAVSNNSAWLPGIDDHGLELRRRANMRAAPERA